MKDFKEKVKSILESEKMTMKQYVDSLEEKEVSDFYYQEIQDFADSNADEDEFEEHDNIADEWYNSAWNGYEVEDEVKEYYTKEAKKKTSDFNEDGFVKILTNKFPFLKGRFD